MHDQKQNTVSKFDESNLKNNRAIFEKPVQGHSKISTQLDVEQYSYAQEFKYQDEMNILTHFEYHFPHSSS